MIDISLLAQAAPQGQSPLNSFFFLIIMLVVMWVILIRPQQKRQKELAKKVEAMKIGDKVITAGGVHGLVHKIKDSVVVLKVAEGVMMDFEKTSIQSVVGKSSSSSSDGSDK